MSGSERSTRPGFGAVTAKPTGDGADTGGDADTGAGETTHPRAGSAAPEPVELSRGTRIRSYVVQGRLASGGFGTIYRVEHEVLGRPAALKVLHAELAGSLEAVRRFELEARTANMINHPNIVDVYDFGVLPDGRPFFVMELLEGVDLDRHLHERGRLRLDEAMAILRPLCDALSRAHAKGIVHRDIKASNVFLARGDEGERVKLLDFGVAKLLDDQNTALTASRNAIGTPACMAPEQILGNPVTARTDIYALGALLYHMITGQLPFADPSVTMMQHMHLHARRPRPSARLTGITAADEVVVRAMALNPDERYQDAAELMAALGERLRGDSDAVIERRSLGVYVDVRVAAGGDERTDEELDDSLLDATASLLARARERLTALGFAAGLDSGNGALLLCTLPEAPAEELEARAARLRELAELAASLQREAGGLGLHVNVTAHAATALWAGERAKGGELTRLAAWVPGVDSIGLIVTDTTLAGTALEGASGPTSRYRCLR